MVHHLIRHATGGVGDLSVIIAADMDAVTPLGIVSGHRVGVVGPIAEMLDERGFDRTPVVETDLVPNVGHRRRT